MVTQNEKRHAIHKHLAKQLIRKVHWCCGAPIIPDRALAKARVLKFWSAMHDLEGVGYVCRYSCIGSFVGPHLSCNHWIEWLCSYWRLFVLLSCLFCQPESETVLFLVQQDYDFQTLCLWQGHYSEKPASLHTPWFSPPGVLWTEQEFDTAFFAQSFSPSSACRREHTFPSCTSHRVRTSLDYTDSWSEWWYEYMCQNN